MTQYEAIASSYDVLERLPYRVMEQDNVHRAIKPLLQPKMKMLELACGTGYYSEILLSWGIDNITGVDISPAMVAVAEDRFSSQPFSSQARFLVADGKKAQSFAPDGSMGYFDMAFGAWFLNYAQTKADLTAMFANVSLNLKKGGVFMAIVPHACNDIAHRVEQYKLSPLNRTFPQNKYISELESGEGWGLRVFLDNNGVDFMTYHLKKQVYEEAARLGGMKGKIEWRKEILLGDDWKQSYGFTAEEWKVREENPHCGILMVWKD